MESYEKFDYSLRPNKRTQRKMIFDALAHYVRAVPKTRYRYVGFGSMWFADFLYAHRRLGLRSLVSIERTEGYQRAKFNQPFKCVRVVEGDASEVLPTLSWRSPSIVWLDYDYSPDRGTLQDVAYLSGQMVSGSVLMVTYDARPPWREDATAEEREDTVRKVFGDAAPPPVRRGRPVKNKAMTHRSTYAPKLAELLWAYLKNIIVQNGRAESNGMAWMPLFTFFYQDKAPMLTVAAALLDSSDRDALVASEPFRELPYARGETIFPIAIPPLTPKERAELDRRLPSRTVALPFPLRQEQIEAYRSLYRYYPLFAEVDL